MKLVTLGKTGISSPQNAFGALPIQRISQDEAVALLRRAYDGGMTYFDTARAYTDSEQKLGLAFKGMREKVTIATKTAAKTPEDFWADLEESLRQLQTDYIDLYQFHFVQQVWTPGDGTGMYECMLEAQKQGKIRHIGVTAHKIGLAFDLVACGAYETLQFPFSYLASKRDVELVRACVEANMGYICMKGMAGGLISRSDAAMAFMDQFDGVLPIWGIQKQSELYEWLSYMDNTPHMNEELAAFIEGEKADLAGDFCRGCGYCLPCTAQIDIPTCARMSLLLRRSPSAGHLTEESQAKMAKIEDCVDCGACKTRCPYGLDTPNLLRRNLADYRRVLAGEVSVQ